ncbi:MAG: hypothetical protein EBY32_15220 [Proteobacteria bacterium]|nr:hypothetical protein [Pseudomonadota bacterium]
MKARSCKKWIHELDAARIVFEQGQGLRLRTGGTLLELAHVSEILLMDEDQEAWTVRTLIRFWLTVPVKIGSHAQAHKCTDIHSKSADALVEAVSAGSLSEEKTQETCQGTGTWSARYPDRWGSSRNLKIHTLGKWRGRFVSREDTYA